LPITNCIHAIVGGLLIDGTGRPPVKDSVVVFNGNKIEAVGRRGEMDLPKGTQIIEAAGKTVCPGFIDAHTHFLQMGINMIRFIDLSGAASLSEALEQVKNEVTETIEGDWVIGSGWDESKWEEKRYINKADLDPISSGHPIMLTRICGHLITMNSNALELAGINKETKDPAGGRIDKGADGEPTGILRDARHLVEGAIPPVTEEIALEGLRRANERALSLGCTGAHDAGLDPFSIRIYRSAIEKGLLKIRVYLMLDESLSNDDMELDVKTGTDEMLRFGSIKVYIDGSLGARTAALFESYEDDSSTKGLLMMTPKELAEKIMAVHRCGLQVAIHAIGDRGIEYAIDAVENALREKPRKDHRHRIEHCEILTSHQIERMGQLGVVASAQPNFVGHWGGPEGLYKTRLGARRMRKNNPYRLLLDEGVRVAFGSDCMPFNPIYGIWSAINHPITSFPSSRLPLKWSSKEA